MFNERVITKTHSIRAEFEASRATASHLLCDRHDPSATAYRFVHFDQSLTELTYGELAVRSRRVAQALADNGISAGDRVATLINKCEDLPAIVLGIWRLGAVYVPLFTAFAAAAVADRLDRAEVKLVVTDAQQFSKVGNSRTPIMLANTAGGATGLDHFDLGDWIRTGTEWSGTSPAGPRVPITLMFTSGTTGPPKLVVHSIDYLAGWKSYLEYGCGVVPDDVFWNVADPGWAYGLYGGLIGPLSLGVASLVTTYPFDPAAAMGVLGEHGVTNFAAAPTVYRAMRAAKFEGLKAQTLKRLSSAGEPLTPDVNEWAIASLGQRVHDHYGQTELGMTIGFAHHADAAIPVVDRAMGTALPGWAVLILDHDSDTPASAGTLGRLAIDIEASGYHTFTGYGLNRDQESSRFTADGRYYVSGDIASMDGHGVIRFAARDDDVILMAGYRIGPSDVESVLVGHPIVSECAVVAGPDDVRGEVIHAFVVPNAPITDLAAAEKSLQQFVREKYAAHAYPRRISFVDALPKTESGKIKRADLKRSLYVRQDA